MHKTRANLPLAVALAAVLATPAAFGQTRTGIACGNIVPAEFTKSQ